MLQPDNRNSRDHASPCNTDSVPDRLSKRQTESVRDRLSQRDTGNVPERLSPCDADNVPERLSLRDTGNVPDRPSQRDTSNAPDHLSQPDTGNARDRVDVVVAAHWPTLNNAERQWLTELTVGSLGWGSRFGEEYSVLIGVPDVDDVALPSGIAMYARPLGAIGKEAVRARVAVVLGAEKNEVVAAVTQFVNAGLPVIRHRDSTPTGGEQGRSWGVADSDSLVHTIFELLAGGVPTNALAMHVVSVARVDWEPPEVSIVIPSFNREAYVVQAVASALAQQYPHRRVVVVDDGSTDGTAAAVSALAPHGVRLIRKTHSGGPASRNTVLRTISSPFVMWLGDDDVLTPNCVESRLRMMARHSDVDVVYGNTLMCDAEFKPREQLAPAEWYQRGDALIAAMFERNQLPDGGTLIRRSSIATAGGYNTAFPKAHDYEFWSRLVGRAVFKHDANVGYLWRWHGANMGIGGGRDPYADAHTRIALGMFERFAPEQLFPEIPWHTLDATTAGSVASFRMASRLVREQAWPEALAFAEHAVSGAPIAETIALRDEIVRQSRAAARAA